MTCDTVRGQLTAYLDGELADDRGSAVRGHLRGCEACRQVATDEAALRDGLRELPAVEVPSTLWAGVQARLAQEEVADSERPAWKRALARWLPSMPQIALGSAVAAAAIVLLVIRHRHETPDVAPVSPPVEIPRVVIAPVTQPAPPAPVTPLDDDADVTDAIAAAPAQLSAEHAAVVRELEPLAAEARARWSDEQKQAYDTQLAALHHDVASAKNEHVRQRHYRALIRFLQRAAIRDEIALASVGGAP